MSWANKKMPKPIQKDLSETYKCHERNADEL